MGRYADFAEANHISAIRAYAAKKYGKDCFTQHFLHRAVQRLTPEDRLAVFAEVRELNNSKMYDHLFDDSNPTVSILIRDKLEAVFTRNSNGALVVKTVIVPKKNRLARLKAESNLN